MRLRPIERRDIERVRELRNRNREWFFDAGEVTAEQQERWFAGLAGRRVAFYVIEEDEQVVGTISLTETGEGREVGNLVLDEAYRGRGLMSTAVAELTAPPGRYFGRVRPDNEASLEVFRRAGFADAHVRLERVVEDG